MHDALPELSTIATTLDELVDRVTATAERLHAEGEETTASDLFDVERALRAAQRRLVGTVRQLQH